MDSDMLGTGLNKIASYQCRGVGNKDRNRKTVSGESFRVYSDPEITCVYFSTACLPNVSWREGNKDFINIIQQG